MNILILSEASYPEHPGGAGKCAHLAASGLAEAGHKVHVLCGTSGIYRRENLDRVTVHRLPLSLRSFPSTSRESVTARMLLSYCEKEIPLSKLDVVHDFGGFLSYFFPLAFQLRQHYGATFVLHFQFLNWGYQSSCERDFRPLSVSHLQLESSVYERIQCYPVRFADLIICPSFSEAVAVQRFFRPSRGRLMVIPNAVEIDELGTCGRARHPALPPEPNAKYLLFGGRIENPMKGADTVFRSLRQLRLQYPQVKLVLLSSSKDWLKRYPDIAPAVIQLGWIREDVEIKKVLRAVDVLVMPSLYEPFGLLCAEALAAGTPVIAAPVGGLREMVRPGYNGFLFRTRNPTNWHLELTQYALRIMRSPQLALALRKQARQFAANRLSRAAQTVHLEAAYQRAIRSRHIRANQALFSPQLSVNDEVRYLDLLEEIGGLEARRAGETVATGWTQRMQNYCHDCTRHSLAEHALALMRLRPRESRSRTMNEKSQEDVNNTVATACPLGLLQKKILQETSIREKGRTKMSPKHF